MLDAQEIGKKLTVLRGDRKRDVVAKDVGISVSALQMYENAQRIPRDEIKVSLAREYNSTVGAIFFGE